jgi:hypothetical protein
MNEALQPIVGAIGLAAVILWIADRRTENWSLASRPYCICPDDEEGACKDCMIHGGKR